MITEIHNIGKVVTFDADINKVVTINLDSILLKDGKIHSIFNNDDSLVVDSYIDAKQSLITPGFIDSHTHLVYASNRSSDFASRVNGESYIDIAKKGGGIKSSIRSLRNISKDQLYKDCLKKTENIIRSGTTTLEAKSGYGLSLVDEIKSLEVIRDLNEIEHIDIIPTFMGAHDFPDDIVSKDSYVDLICSEMIPEIANLKLAEFCDVFYENGFFDETQTRKICEIAQQNNFSIKLHVDEFEDSNGAYLAGEFKAVSADHLMKSNDNGLMNMARNNVIATILPGTTLFLGMDTYANARRIIDLGCDLSIATDYNPGSCTIYSLPFIMALSCLYCGLTIDEAFAAVTFNAAKAINRSDSIGLVKENYNADLLFWDINNISEIPYWMNSDKLMMIIKNGKLI